MLLVHQVDGRAARRHAAIGSFRHELHGCKPAVPYSGRAARNDIEGNPDRAVSVTYPIRRPTAVKSPHKTPAHSHEQSPGPCMPPSQPGDDYPPRKSALMRPLVGYTVTFPG